MNQSDETKRCRHCQSEIPKKAKVCPECRKKQHGKLKWAILAVVIIGIGAAAGGSGNGQDEPLVQKVADLQDTGENQNADQNSSGAENGKKDTDKSGTKENGQTEIDQKESGEKDNGKPASGKKNNTDNNGKADAEGKNDSGNIFVTGDVIETSVLRISFLSAEQYISDNEFIQPEKGHIYYKTSPVRINMFPLLILTVTQMVTTCSRPIWTTHLAWTPHFRPGESQKDLSYLKRRLTVRKYC